MLSIPKRTPRPPAPLSPKPLQLPTGQITSQLDIVRAMHAKGRPALTLAQFVSASWEILEPSTPLQWNWHLDALCSHVEALLLDKPGPRLQIELSKARLKGIDLAQLLALQPELAGEVCPQNLLINVPPGCMKSLIFSVFAPAWIWLHRPGWRAIYASGNPSVVTRDSLKCRNLIKSDWYQQTFRPSWQISVDQDEKQHFANTKGGYRRGIGAGGVVTGDRADFLGVDDANDAKEIHQKSHRVQINENWWDNAWHNRIADPTASKRGIIMQRLHEEDLAGHVIENEGLASKGGLWAHFVIAMEAEADGPGDKVSWLGWSDPRKLEGELMFPERFHPKYLEGELLTLRNAGYAGQMQQRPVAAAGNRFLRSWWRFWSPTGEKQVRPKGANDVAPLKWNPIEDLSRCYEVIASWDCTFKDTDGSDYVANVVVAIDGARRIVLERGRARLSFGNTKKEIRAQHERHPYITETLVEDAANGPAVISDLESEIPGLIAVRPLGGKEARAAVMEPKVEAGNWYLPEGAPWLDEWFNEYGAFPNGKHDDQVDAGSQVECRLLGDRDEQHTRALLGMPVTMPG